MRTTITMNDTIYRALRHRAAETNASISALVEDAVKYQILEDLEDLEAVDGRVHEPAMSFDGFVKTLKADGLL